MLRIYNGAVQSLARSHGLLLVAILPLCLAGCAAYRMGNSSLYAPDISTVYVPMIECDSFRRDLGERLTEAVVNEIELKTPFKVVSNPSADAVLQVRLFNDVRHTIIEDAFDSTRLAENQLRAEVSFINYRRGGFAPPAPQVIPLPYELAGTGQSSLLIPAVGQTVSSSQQQAIDRLAQQIVGAMEEGW